MGIAKERIDRFNGAVKYLGIAPGFITILDKLCPECGIEHLIAVNGDPCTRCANCRVIITDEAIKRDDMSKYENTKARRIEKESMAKNKRVRFH